MNNSLVVLGASLSNPGLHSTGISPLDIAARAVGPPELGILTPLYQVLYGILKKYNIDISGIARKAVLAFGAAVGIQILWSYFKPFLVTHFTSSLTLPSEHLKAKHIEEWMRLQGRTNSKRHIEFTATEVHHDISTQTKGIAGEKRSLVSGGIFFYGKRPLYISFSKGNLMNCDKMVVYNCDREGGMKEVALSGDSITVYSLDTSGNLLERFMEEVAASHVSEVNITPVYTVTDMGGPNVYETQIKTSRSFSTIDLDEGIKRNLLNDVDKFFSPGRREWYGKLGIPYKRGYLLQGHPGTGKSSIALALAGHIKGGLYTIALGQVNSEGHLVRLFDKVPSGSVLLLEDVDSSGIDRENIARETPPSPTGDPYMDAFRRVKKKITLSGLLNAIDALHEGVLLVMTTNEPETLDKALIRPGRVDKQFHIGCASQHVAGEIFKRFYDAEDSEKESARIAELAVQFSQKIPNLKFTPAEIQGYLIPLSDDPDEAIAGTCRRPRKLARTSSAKLSARMLSLHPSLANMV